jgi:hypothetical protein
VSGLVELVRKDHPERVRGLPPDEIERRVVEALATAKGYGLTGAQALAGFVSLSFEVSPGFHRHPGVAAILGWELLPPDQRVDVLVRALPARFWREARAIGDQGAPRGGAG